MEKGNEGKLLEREGLNRLGIDKEGGGLRGHTTVEHSRWEGMSEQNNRKTLKMGESVRIQKRGSQASWSWARYGSR